MMCIEGCLYRVVQQLWRIYGRNNYLTEVRSTDVDGARAICYDEAVYPRPHNYDPTRFLNKDGQINSSVMAPEMRIFGSGRR